MGPVPTATSKASRDQVGPLQRRISLFTDLKTVCWMVHVWTEVWFSSAPWDHSGELHRCHVVMLNLLHLVCLCVTLSSTLHGCVSLMCVIVSTCLSHCHHEMSNNNVSWWNMRTALTRFSVCQTVTSFLSLCSRLPEICINTPIWPSWTNLVCVECDLLLWMSSDAPQLIHHHQLLTLKLTKNTKYSSYWFNPKSLQMSQKQFWFFLIAFPLSEPGRNPQNVSV